ncbi:MAG: insulinase family protein [Holosporaceae bacterium]|jgi:predicted Zn-dependent peptidase|nr:insulinase family protein [Holosporaceae bacterium]
MLIRLVAIFSFLIFSHLNANEDKYRGASFQKLDNGMSVVFVDTTKSNALLVMLCISSGSTDEIDKHGVANLLNYMFAKKLKESVNVDSLQYGSESNAYAGHDQSIYYFYGKLENLEGFIKNLGVIFSSFTFSTDELKDSKKMVERQILEDQDIDKNAIRYESRKSLYWHSNYGIRISGDLDDLKSISEEDIQEFKNKHYTNGRATLIIAGNVDKNHVLKEIAKYFKTTAGKSEPINRLQEPQHHGSTVRLTKQSLQVSVPIIEMYWRIPNYRNQKNKALAAEIFINHLDEALQKNLIENQKIVTSISFTYSFWNYDYGDFCMTVTSKNSDKIEEVITAILSEIKCIASEKITQQQAQKAAKKLAASANVFHYDVDVVDFVDWVSKKIGSCYDFDFLRSYWDFVNKFDLNEVNALAKEIFKNDPCVISVIKPVEEKGAN